MSKEEGKKTNITRKIINIFLILIILVVGIIMYARFIGVKGLYVREYRVSSEKIPSNYSGVKIVHFSDLLFGSTTSFKDTENLVKKINELKPDLVFFTGGLISENTPLSEDEVEKLGSILKEIDATTGKYAVRGSIDEENFDIIMNQSDFKVLENSGEFIYHKGLIPIYLGGVSSSIKDAVNVESTFEVLESDANKDAYFKILLMHEGDSATYVFEKRDDVDLILGGNSLNGSVIIPFYGGVYLPRGSKKYYEEYYKVGESEIFISAGIGTNNFSYRFNNRPSFNLYRLNSL